MVETDLVRVGVDNSDLGMLNTFTRDYNFRACLYGEAGQCGDSVQYSAGDGGCFSTVMKKTLALPALSRSWVQISRF